MKDLDQRHFSSGGTGITNFDPKDEPIYKAAIELYEDQSIVISNLPLEGHSLSGDKSLHWLNAGVEGKGSLSTFWDVFGAYKKGLEDGITSAETSGARS